MTTSRILIDYDGRPVNFLLDTDRAFDGLPQLDTTIFKAASVGFTPYFLTRHYSAVLNALTKIAVDAWYGLCNVDPASICTCPNYPDAIPTGDRCPKRR